MKTIFTSITFLALVACSSRDKDGGATDTDTDSGAAHDTDIDTSNPTGARGFVVASLVTTPDATMTYIQFVDQLTGKLDNTHAVEVPSFAAVEGLAGAVFTGLAEEPTWVRYEVDDDGVLQEAGRLSFAAHGWASTQISNVMISDTLAFSVQSQIQKGMFWNPSDMSIVASIDLPELTKGDFSTESWPVTYHDGLIYIPARHVNWMSRTFDKAATLVVVDATKHEVVKVYEDDRCPISGAPLFDADGNLYLMSDGRNYSVQTAELAAGADPTPNCWLKLPAGSDSFDVEWLYTVPGLTGGHDAFTTNEVVQQGSGIAFAQVLYPENLSEDVDLANPAFWYYDVSKLWKFDFSGETPEATEVAGVPALGISYKHSHVGNKLVLGVTAQALGAQQAEVYAVDNDTAQATKLFTMDGNFYGVYPIGGASL